MRRERGRYRAVAGRTDGAHGGTLTAQGWIPHLHLGSLRCPVMLAVLDTGSAKELIADSDGRPHPVRHGGLYVFALPGGGSIKAARW